MRLTDRRKTAKHLARRRKNCQILTDGREKSRLLKKISVEWPKLVITPLDPQ